jgi:hypothetical protein
MQNRASIDKSSYAVNEFLFLPSNFIIMLLRNLNKVLSFSPDPRVLQSRESALRNSGFDVTSVGSESQARFEIEMGRCGVLLICFRVPEPQLKDLSKLFRKNCPDGHIIFVMKDKAPPVFAEAVVAEGEGLQKLVSVAAQIAGKGLDRRSA